MTPKRIILMANDIPGVEVAKFLTTYGDTIVGLYLHPESRRKHGEEIIAAVPTGVPVEITGKDFFNDEKNAKRLNDLKPDFIITVYWTYILPPPFLNAAREGTVNFHPALLPQGRGWYPHVHAIAKSLPLGVTLHTIKEEVDTGEILVQEETKIYPTDTSFEVYHRQQQHMIDLFKKNWEAIRANAITPRVQDNSLATYFAKDAVNELDALALDAPTTAREVLNLLRARSFGDRGFAYFMDNGKKIYVNISLKAE